MHLELCQAGLASLRLQRSEAIATCRLICGPKLEDVALRRIEAWLSITRSSYRLGALAPFLNAPLR